MKIRIKVSLNQKEYYERMRSKTRNILNKFKKKPEVHELLHKIVISRGKERKLLKQDPLYIEFMRLTDNWKSSKEDHYKSMG